MLLWSKQFDSFKNNIKGILVLLQLQLDDNATDKCDILPQRKKHLLEKLEASSSALMVVSMNFRKKSLEAIFSVTKVSSPILIHERTV